MLDIGQKNDEFPAGPMGFAAFVRRYAKDEQFVKWFEALDSLLDDMAGCPKQVTLERLIVTEAHLKLLVRYLDPQATYAGGEIANLDLITRTQLRTQLANDGIRAPNDGL